MRCNAMAIAGAVAESGNLAEADWLFSPEWDAG